MITKSSQEKQIRFAIVGCGRIAERHAEHITNLGVLVAVCDVLKERADIFAKKHEAKAYYSIDDLFADAPEVDVVSICTPNGLHAEHSIKALQAGYNVLCEKPMALTVRDCERMILEAEKAGKKLFIVKQNRFNPPIAHAKQIIQEGKLGKILSVQLNCFWNRNEDYYKNSPWKGTIALDGGALYTQFSHFIDLLYWMFGEVEELSAVTKNSNHPNIEIDDEGVVSGRFTQGTLFTIHYTTNSYGKNMEGSLTVFGEKGTMKIGGEYLNVFEYANIENYTIPELPQGNKANDYGTYKGSMSNHDKVYGNVVSVMSGGGAISTSGMEGLKTVEIISKIYNISSPWRE